MGTLRFIAPDSGMHPCDDAGVGAALHRAAWQTSGMRYPSFDSSPMRRRQLVHAAALAAALPLMAQGETWPARELRWVVPFPSGGTTDFLTRFVADELGHLPGHKWVVQNLPGQGTVTGVNDVAQAPADGHHVVTVTNGFCINETLARRLPYRRSDLRPVALMAVSEHVLAAHPATGLKNVADIVLQYENGKALSYASFGSRSSTHLAGEMLKNLLGTPGIQHVPFESQASALNAVLTGKVSMMFGNWAELRAPIAANRLNALGLASEMRSAFAPGVPTLGEQGAPVQSDSWSGVLAPARVADDIVTRMNREINAVLRSASAKTMFEEYGLVCLAGSVQQFAQFIDKQIRHAADVIYRTGIPFQD